MTEELAKQKQTSAQLSRSVTIAGDTAGLPLDLEHSAQLVANQGRRALYGTLPFMSAFGMQGHENSVRKVLTTASCNALDALTPRDTQVSYTLSSPQACYPTDLNLTLT